MKDASGCIATTNITVGSTGGPAATAASTPANCGTSNGSITVTGTGTAPFTYSINGITFQAGNIFSAVAAGNYFVFVKDAAGCIGAAAITVNTIAGPSVTATTTAAACTVNNGTITATGSGGTGGLQYSIDGITYVSTAIFSNLAPATYTVFVKDAAGCISTIAVTVSNASGLGLTLSAVSSSCGSNGIITAVATGGVLPLQYNINGGAYQSGNIFSGLPPGLYSINVKDANGCIVNKTVTVVAVSALSLTATVALQASCASSNAVIVATGSGGASPLTYSINGTVYQSSGTFLNLAPGTYTVYVKDAAGCIQTQAGLVITTGSVGAGITTFTVVTKYFPCDGDVTGKITNPRVNGSNCNSCTFSLDFGPYIPNAAQLYTGVLPGIHFLTAKDAGGCTKTIQVNMLPTATATATAAVTGAPCGIATGSITLTGVGGTPYHVSIDGGATWITFATTTTFSNLLPNAYSIIIADDASFTPPASPGGCTNTITVVVPATTGTLAVSTTPVNATCGFANGTITVSGSGGTSPYSYSINGGAFQPGAIFTGLSAGTYIMAVKDNAGCIKTASVIIASSGSPVITVSPSATSCGLLNGIITVTSSSGGLPPYEYSINGTVFQPGTVFNNLTPGPYSVYIKDAAGCFTVVTTVVAIGTVPKVTAFTVSASCNGNNGSIFVTGSLGVAPYQFSLDNATWQSDVIFSGLPAGFYTVYMKDNAGCVVTTGVSIGNINAPTIATVVTAAKCGNQNGAITVTATGGTPAYQYSSDGGLTYQASNILSPLFPGNYAVAVKDGNGCISTTSVFVNDLSGPQTLTAVTVNAACGGANGIITLTATGGTPAYQFSSDGITYQAGNILSGLSAGSYTVYVRDVNLCTKTLTVVIEDLVAPAVSLAASASGCGFADGTVTVTASGGTLALMYSIDGVNFQSSNIFTGLTTGPYTVTVKDARGCLATGNIIVPVIGSPVTPVFNSIAPICSGAVLTALPTTSLNGVTGTWAPPVDNTATTVYTFTPAAGECANTMTLTITVNPKPLPIIISHN